MKKKYFKSQVGDIPLPVFFPDATRAIVKTLDSEDIKNTKTLGILVNTYHLFKDLGGKVIEKHHGIRGFMNWHGGVISDSGGFQVMSIVKNTQGKGHITDSGVTFKTETGKKINFTPEKSIAFQMELKPDMVVVLDDFTDLNASYEKAKETVDRTILWAKKCKEEFIKQCQRLNLAENNRPYLLAVVQGDKYLDLRLYCIKELLKIGFDGFGYGGWPVTKEGNFNYDVARVIAENSPENYLLYGLGIGKPEEIVGCVNLGFDIFDCVLPTRDARHKRLYIYNADSIEEINVHSANFYSYYTPDKESHYLDTSPVSRACDCLLCTKYTRAYLAHLFRIEEPTALRLSTIHNLRFYSILMEKLQNQTE